MHIRSSMRCAMFAAAAIVGGSLVTIAPAAAQQWEPWELPIREIDASIKRPVDGWRAAHFYRGELQVVGPGVIYPVALVDNMNANPSGLRYYRPIAHSATSLTVKSSDDKETLIFDFTSKTISGTSGGVPITGEIGKITSESCTPLALQALCACDLSKLRPLQGAVGLGEVAKKTKDINEELAKEKADLLADPIKIVKGSGGDLFITDHHHGALAWKNAGYATGICYNRPALDSDTAKFRAEIEKQKLVRLDDEGGNPVTWDNLPTKLEQLGSHNDPYRTLAWMVRKADANGFNSDKTPKLEPGFCRAYITGATDFTEFAWADAMRENGKTNAALATATVTAATAPALWGGKKAARLDKQVPVLQAALAFAKSDPAKTLPGVRGDKQYNGADTCPPDPVEPIQRW